MVLTYVSISMSLGCSHTRDSDPSYAILQRRDIYRLSQNAKEKITIFMGDDPCMWNFKDEVDY